MHVKWSDDSPYKSMSLCIWVVDVIAFIGSCLSLPTAITIWCPYNIYSPPKFNSNSNSTTKECSSLQQWIFCPTLAGKKQCTNWDSSQQSWQNLGDALLEIHSNHKNADEVDHKLSLLHFFQEVHWNSPQELCQKITAKVEHNNLPSCLIKFILFRNQQNFFFTVDFNEHIQMIVKCFFIGEKLNRIFVHSIVF